MKKCEYCAKEIGYNDMYCSDECEKLAIEYYEKRTKLQKLMSAVNIIGTCFIAVGIFLYAIINFIGAVMMAVGGLSLGIINIVLPTPTDNMINKSKLKKATITVRIIGCVLLLFGICATVLAISKF
ncbi:MAG: hypothetical protein ACI4GZ_02220 [Ruminococcus sp.]